MREAGIAIILVAFGVVVVLVAAALLFSAASHVPATPGLPRAVREPDPAAPAAAPSATPSPAEEDPER